MLLIAVAVFDIQYREEVYKWWVEGTKEGKKALVLEKTGPFAIPRSSAGIDYKTLHVVPPLLFQQWVAKMLCETRDSSADTSPFEQLRIMVRYNPPVSAPAFQAECEPKDEVMGSADLSRQSHRRRNIHSFI